MKTQLLDKYKKLKKRIMKIILGNITFLEATADKGKKAIVHEVFGVLDTSKAHFPSNVEEKSVAHEIAEDLCSLFTAYLIPQLYDGEVEYECLAKCSFDVSELEG